MFDANDLEFVLATSNLILYCLSLSFVARC